MSAGISPDDPGLAHLRKWNAAAMRTGRISVETRRGQFGKTIRTTLSVIEQEAPE